MLYFILLKTAYAPAHLINERIKQSTTHPFRLSSRRTHCLEQSSWPPPSDQWH